ncbi:MAG: Twin-arginine translocation protein TatA [Candidatus Kapaibacterium sp.]|jgi:sec-independent protein translocase protein TatA|nr:MAG: Twin-arginine translocation protein TatA [Candidatus Kapabacteria bacterium]ROL56614.1 MAG: twin-arginine translocase TatA/TatE family subunit [Bacteroidetes/Chlorobi group bacterium Naka2016]
MFNLGPTELILIAVVILLIFGGKKIPELMRGLGQGLKEFKKATSDDVKDSTVTKSDDKKVE